MNNLNVGVVGIGEQGANAIDYIKSTVKLPFHYFNSNDFIVDNDLDCLVIISALEDDYITTQTINLIKRCNAEQLTITIALESDASRIAKINTHDCVIVAQNMPTSFEFAAITVKYLFNFFYQPSTLFEIDLAELKLLLVPNTIAVSTLVSDFQLSDSLTKLNEYGIKCEVDVQAYINIVQPKLNIKEIDIVTAMLSNHYKTSEYLLCNTIDDSISCTTVFLIQMQKYILC